MGLFPGFVAQRSAYVCMCEGWGVRWFCTEFGACFPERTWDGSALQDFLSRTSLNLSFQMRCSLASSSAVVYVCSLWACGTSFD